MRAARGEGNFLDLMKRDERIAGKVDEKKLESLFDVNFYIRHVDKIFERFGL